MKKQAGERRARFVAGVAAMAAVLVPRVTLACEVCYGKADSPWIDATQAAVFLMLGVTVAVQLAFAVFFLRLRSRMRSEAAKRSGMKVIEGKGAA